jgi:hypothetical protein
VPARLLVEVLSQRRVAETSYEKAVDASCMTLEELAEGSFVSRLIGRHENLVGSDLAHTVPISAYARLRRA